MAVPFPTVGNVGEDLSLESKSESSRFGYVKFERTEKGRKIKSSEHIMSRRKTVDPSVREFYIH